MSIRPAIPTVFSQSPRSGSPQVGPSVDPPVTGPIPRVRYGIRRTNSLPDRLNQSIIPKGTGTQALNLRQVSGFPVVIDDDKVEDEENISRTTAVLLLLINWSCRTLRRVYGQLHQ